MTLTVSRGEGLTIITITSNPKSKWPVLCEILGFLCYSPSCFVSQGMKGKLKDIHTALGIVQMLIGVLNIAVGIVFTCVGLHYDMYSIAQGSFWLGSVFLLSGIVCILAAKFPTSSLLIMGMILNGVNFALAVVTVVVYSVALANDHNEYRGICNYYSPYDYGTPSPKEIGIKEICLSYKNEIIFRGLEIMMIVLSVLQICVTISFCVLTREVLFKKVEDVKSVEDPELHKPLLEDATAAAAC
ncbi:uncharacterized protein LOC131522578 isoform X1 [Onychostoma macrolepis]|uniref:uncharacterized protein LOC131522578 isoform X1 n=1 Tax=Onychostoma macrolepis TaxID=369639 RepID=UPI00272D0201|nr:uncharacterized protein LOC131522578 isoform X1 [Onychostoma macrolepis]